MAEIQHENKKQLTVSFLNLRRIVAIMIGFGDISL